MSLLKNRLALHKFVCLQFGYQDVSAMLEQIGTEHVEFESYSDFPVILPLNPRSRVSYDHLAAYNSNIEKLSRSMNMTTDRGRTWKPHQYLALLFTEYYLHRYFDDIKALATNLNEFLLHSKLAIRPRNYELDDLHTLAFQSATGSGKTLLMHANILQYQHYLEQTGKHLNNIVLLTPNEQMSSQHLRDLADSGIHARLFSHDASSELFSTVEILDLNKLAEKKGVKRVAVSDFGENNLVLVDEGHLGASGKVWRERRNELSSGGFTFEYSATFNQVTSKKENRHLLEHYSKSLIYDYSYNQFYTDGYGKDYSISNLPNGYSDQNSNMYLLGCLLTFFQQCSIWKDNSNQWREFNLSKPLWVFLGKTVVGSSNVDKESRSDVIKIIRFFAWFLANEAHACQMMQQLMSGQSGLIDDTGNDYFDSSFAYLDVSPEEIYGDICSIIFNGKGILRVTYLTAGEGELHLSTGNNETFGVINIGDSTSLYNLLNEISSSEFTVEREMGFRELLFNKVDNHNSTINIVVGARRFIAGWNSWRVSTMGLMHVGVGEGPEIIQMFGRGVRLKGHSLSLKRHTETDIEPPPDSKKLSELEKLYIFGLRANYMQTFKDLLEKEGMQIEKTKLTLPVTWNFARNQGLKLIRLKSGMKYVNSKNRPALPQPSNYSGTRVSLDQYSQLQSIASSTGNSALPTQMNTVKLSHYSSYMDSARIYSKLVSRKLHKEWHNYVITKQVVEDLLSDDTWYELYMPPDQLKLRNFADLQKFEDIALEMMTHYADNNWRRARQKWEHSQTEIVPLDKDDPNVIGEYKLSLDTRETELIKAIRAWKKDMTKDAYSEIKLGALWEHRHAYQPLLYKGKDSLISVEPVALDENEAYFVKTLADLAHNDDACLQERELYLIRNLAKGKGVSFFDDYSYFPDFIIWLKLDNQQDIIFIDPKGLGRIGTKERKKIDLHMNIKNIEQEVCKNDPDLRLHAYVLSVTPPNIIDDGSKSREDWKNEGVYFLRDISSIKDIIEDVLS